MQTWPRDQIEVIVVDNGSTPAIQIDPLYGDFVCLTCCNTPGSYAARNVGMGMARGNVIAFTDADCLPDRDWIRSGVTALQQEKDRSIIGGEIKMSLSQQPTVVERYQYLTGFMQRENIEHLGFSVTANLFATREQVERLGPFEENLLSGGDREWSWRAAQHGYGIRYSETTIIHTSPRSSMLAAMRQARRVTGGRLTLRQLERTHISSAGVKPHRSTKSAIKWIFTHPELTPWMRIKVFIVASILKITQMIEAIRLKTGVRPERR